MATEKIFNNIYGDQINKIQLSSMSDYNIKTIIDNKLKMIERFEDKILTGGDYYLGENENKIDLIQDYCINKKQNWYFHFNQQISGVFTLWDWEAVDENGNIYFKGKRVLGNKNRKVFYCKLDLETNELKGVPVKIFYQNIYDDENKDVLFKFYYKDDGTLYRVEDPNENYLDKIVGAKPQDFIDSSYIQAVFPWEDHPYYHSALPYLPTGSL